MQVSPVTLANQTQRSGVMRLLGVAFPGEQEREAWEREQEESRKRDHRRIGKVRGGAPNPLADTGLRPTPISTPYPFKTRGRGKGKG